MSIYLIQVILTEKIQFGYDIQLIQFHNAEFERHNNCYSLLDYLTFYDFVLLPKFKLV